MGAFAFKKPEYDFGYNTTGKIRVVVATFTACMGAIMWGYDSGVIGGVLKLPSFISHFHSEKHTSKVSSTAVSLLQAGGFFGALLMSPVCKRFGRKWAITGSAAVFIIGAIMQTTGTGGLGLLYAGRVIAGLGVGAATTVVPTYVAEIVPPSVRGLLMGFWQVFIVFGVTISYWVVYAVQQRVDPTTNMQWRIPVALQLVPPGLLIIGTSMLRESPRWLVTKGRDQQALENLAFMRNMPIDSPEIQGEFNEIQTSVLLEQEVTGGVNWKEIFVKGNRKRVLLGFILMGCQQFSGTNAIGYYAPQIFEAVGVSSTSTGLFATGLYGVVKVVMTTLLALFAVETLGRKFCLSVGGFLMGAFMLIIGCLLKTHPPDADNANLSSASYAMVVCIYFYVTFYCFSWGPVPWIYCSEIFPNRIREYCVAICASSQWLFNFVVTEFSPYALDSIGWGIFILFAGFNFANCVYALFLPETSGKTLEEMDELFHVPYAVDHDHIESKAAEYAHVETAESINSTRRAD